MTHLVECMHKYALLCTASPSVELAPPTLLVRAPAPGTGVTGSRSRVRSMRTLFLVGFLVYQSLSAHAQSCESTGLPHLSFQDSDSTSAILTTFSQLASISTTLSILTTTNPPSCPSISSPSSAGINVTISNINSTISNLSQILLSNLTPSTNYTVYLSLLNPPLFFITQPATSPCRLIPFNSIPLCPSLSYSIPSPPELSTPDLISFYNTIVNQSHTAFNRTLSTFPCGEESRKFGMGLFSQISTCDDCWDAYRDWSCSVSIPRCSTSSPTNTSFPILPSSYKTILPRSNPNISRTPLLSQNNLQTTFSVPDLTSPFPYNEVPPCLSLCQLVQARCPPFLSWTCPVDGGTGTAGYGVNQFLKISERMGGDQDGLDSEQNQKVVGMGERAGDRFGNVLYVFSLLYCSDKTELFR